MPRRGASDPSRKIYSVEMTPAAMASVNKVADERGMNKNKVVERVLVWFAAQPEAVQSVVMRKVDRGMSASYATALEQMAGDLRRSPAPAFDHLYGGEGEASIPPSSPAPGPGGNSEDGGPLPARTQGKRPAAGRSRG